MKPTLEELKENLEFELDAFALEGGVSDALKEHIAKVAEYFQQPRLRGPLFALTQEFAANALKAVYKQIYFEFFVKELGLEEITYEDWLRLFRTEIESHQTENFERVARENNMPVEVKYLVDETFFTIFIRNPGTPSDVELRRIQTSLSNAHKLTDMSYLFDDDLDEDEEKEGAGIGIPLLIMTLRGLGVKATNLSITTKDNYTMAQIKLPLIVLLKEVEVKPQTVSFFGGDLGTALKDLDLFFIQLDVIENIHKVSDNFLQRFDITIDEIKEKLPEGFLNEIFRGPKSVRVLEKFHNYRVSIEGLADGKTAFFNISGYITEESRVNTIWHLLNPEFEELPINEGSFSVAMQVQQLIKPYLPENLVETAKQAAAQGQEALRDEYKDVAVLFANIAGLLTNEENRDPHQEISLLNIAIAIIVNSVKKNKGRIDRVYGQDIMAVFADTQEAAIAAMEIQRLFIELNHYRRNSGETEIAIKTAIDRGDAQHTSLGTADEKYQATFGSAVDRAEIILKRARAGLVYLSDNAYEGVKDQVEIEGKATLRHKSSNEEMQVFAATQIKFHKNELEFIIALKTPVVNEV